MPDTNATAVQLVQDEPWIFLDVRSNPVKGRKLTYRLDDGTLIELDVTPAQYRDAAGVKARLQIEIDAHRRLAG